MPKVYQTTAHFTVDVEAECENCGHKYTYSHHLSSKVETGLKKEAIPKVNEQTAILLREYRNIIYSGNFNRKEWWLVKLNFSLSNSTWLKIDHRSGLGFEKCPECGYTQSWMVKPLQGSIARTGAGIIAGIVALLIIIGILRSPDTDNILVKIIAGMVIASFVAFPLYHLLTFIFALPVVLFYKPNRKFSDVSRTTKPVIVNVRSGVNQAAKIEHP